MSLGVPDAAYAYVFAHDYEKYTHYRRLLIMECSNDALDRKIWEERGSLRAVQTICSTPVIESAAKDLV